MTRHRAGFIEVLSATEVRPRGSSYGLPVILREGRIEKRPITHRANHPCYCRYAAESSRAIKRQSQQCVCLAKVEPRPRGMSVAGRDSRCCRENSISHVLQGNTPARGTHTFRFAICSRSRSSFSRASGVKFSPKSVNSYTGRISTSDSPGIGFGQRFNHSTASSMDRTCHIQ